MGNPMVHANPKGKRKHNSCEFKIFYYWDFMFLFCQLLMYFFKWTLGLFVWGETDRQERRCAHLNEGCYENSHSFLSASSCYWLFIIALTAPPKSWGTWLILISPEWQHRSALPVTQTCRAVKNWLSRRGPDGCMSEQGSAALWSGRGSRH